jgi:hypothetical protein
MQKPIEPFISDEIINLLSILSHRAAAQPATPQHRMRSYALSEDQQRVNPALLSPKTRKAISMVELWQQ